jgi:formylglycine-generating enzyme required for sulfatase activity
LALPAFARALAAAAEADLDYRLPAGVDPIHIRADGKSVRPLELREQAGHLVVSDQSGGDGSLLGLLRGGNGLVQVGQWVAVPEGAGAFWALGRVPAWAEDWGTDASGPWASFSVTARDGSRVTQRLRWCPPGRFQMGSPDNEEERWSDEGPLHEVTIADGFWMFETACTEALWEAVTGQAPEPRRGPGFPVTGVSWNDAQDFVRALNATKPGLDLGLPTEAWWEYACRAGTETPYSFGKTISKDQACYESRAPVPVGSLPPNTWGLHEMHGNVWEWCTDHWHGDYEGAPTDGSAWIAPRAAAIRVVRGGSWDVTARSVRAACRYGLDPAFRYGNLGFRCARVQAASGSDRAEQVAAPEAPASRSGAERRRPQGPTSDATLLRGGVAAPAVLPGAAEPLGRNALNLTWASRSGRDRFGIFADLTPPHTEVTQRLRWIPRGRFQMGSPASEEGRADWEGPQREVALAAGFWLFDTPCTQALWEGIMGENPSRFRSALRPVEQVSFDDVRAFLTRINHRVPGLDLLLPSEAQWEYACRAGTTTATYAGEMQILGENNAPILDTIAWYGGNSGVGFELKKGEDSGSWRNKQYPHKRAGTRLVAQKAPNPWGLYDMLGNVWEWCADHWHDSYEGAPSDGSAWLDSQGAASRVVRGGSWLDYARYVRAACRDWAVPAFSLGNLGFRCARVQAASESDPAEQVAAPEAPASRSGAERRRPQGPTSDATLLRVGVSAPAPLPRAPALLIRTDREELHLRQVSRADPDLAWASGLGRDRHGLFADLTVPETDVTQRLRWIPPGRFTMGSPESEEGRFDWEGPQHEVTLAEGFWLFDTPCTQAVWNAVMGNYPSEFRSPTRPVEQVTFDDAQGFLVRLNGLVPGLSLVLPSEAEWEYACRAGTHTATYAGEMQILGENNSPVLDAIAWYGGNSGVDFDLENGRDTKGWPNKQYPHEKAGTHPVAGKAPNAWGLYDMLGNVWEWCADHWHDSYEGAPTDGTAWIAPQGAADRVVRGGSWLGNARLVRAAYRGRNVPAVSSGYLGFRCARVQVAGEAERRAGRSKPSERSERAATPRPERSGARARSTPISKRK